MKDWDQAPAEGVRPTRLGQFLFGVGMRGVSNQASDFMNERMGAGRTSEMRSSGRGDSLGV